MSATNTKPHKHKILTPVKFVTDGKMYFGIIISASILKLSRRGKKDEPYYLISGYGDPIWEGDLRTIDEDEYNILIAQFPNGCKEVN